MAPDRTRCHQKRIVGSRNEFTIHNNRHNASADRREVTFGHAWTIECDLYLKYGHPYRNETTSQKRSFIVN
ncbi:hypothetical protein EDC02_2589 [Micromonospora sp. Llam0]|nr:hypothetical protein EDC02_2589 [Micromonospora sp. Llam0]